jgi:cytidylate kinase
MNRKLSPERLAAVMEGVLRHWQNRQKAESLLATSRLAHAGLTIALSRESGTHGTSIAYAIGGQLGWPVYDRELLERIAGEMGLRATLLESVDERRRPWLLEFVETFASVPAVTQSAFMRHLIETVISLGVHGECVIVGRGAAQLLRPETTLRVRLVAPLSERIAAKSRDLVISPEEAARQIEETDRGRVRFIKDHFLKDPTDCHLYDLVLNSSRFPITECVDLIIEALHRMEKRALGKRHQELVAS